MADEPHDGVLDNPSVRTRAPDFAEIADGYTLERAQIVIDRWHLEGTLPALQKKRGIDWEVAAGIAAKAVDLHGRSIMRAAALGRHAVVQSWIDAGLPINMQAPQSGLTMLHVAAANGARRTVMALLDSGRCNVLVRDRRGRLAWELCDDDVLADALMKAQVETVTSLAEIGKTVELRLR